MVIRKQVISRDCQDLVILMLPIIVILQTAAPYYALPTKKPLSEVLSGMRFKGGSKLMVAKLHLETRFARVR